MSVKGSQNSGENPWNLRRKWVVSLVIWPYLWLGAAHALSLQPFLATKYPSHFLLLFLVDRVHRFTN